MEAVHSSSEGTAHLDTPSLAILAIASGLLFHSIISRPSFEFERIMYIFIALFILIFIILVALFSEVGNFSVLTSFEKACIVAASFNGSVLLSMSVYRLFFHRLREFPGPALAKLTRFYAMHQSAKNVEYYKELQRMHDMYGDFVRTGMPHLKEK